MDYYTKKLDEIRVLGFKITIKKDTDKTNIQKLWMDKFQNGDIDKLLKDNNATKNDLLGISYNVKSPNSFDYCLALPSTKKSIETLDNLEELTIPASNYIVLKGSNKDIPKMYEALSKNIILKDEYTANNFSIEMYKTDGECEIYMAIK